MTRAAVHEDLARQALAAGFRVSAGEHFNRAYKYRPQSADWMARQLGLSPL
jgi:hypothetical protein